MRKSEFVSLLEEMEKRLLICFLGSSKKLA